LSRVAGRQKEWFKRLKIQHLEFAKSKGLATCSRYLLATSIFLSANSV